MAHYDFNKDISEGERGEQIVVKQLEKLNFEFITDNKNYKFDAIMLYKDKLISFEIKTDLLITKERETGNMFIEYECRGKDSGILTSRANMFVMYFPHKKKMWMISMRKLRELIAKNEFREISMAGDKGSNTKGFLLPRFKLVEHFKIYTIDYEWETT